jgi:hypothetical protein
MELRGLEVTLWTEPSELQITFRPRKSQKYTHCVENNKNNWKRAQQNARGPSTNDGQYNGGTNARPMSWTNANI